ncbi:hypothetical protein ACP70R_034440 [Stipagrostis hirtigluma subsp. patula]
MANQVITSTWQSTELFEDTVACFRNTQSPCTINTESEDHTAMIMLSAATTEADKSMNAGYSTEQAINQPAAPATNDAMWSLYDLINARVGHRDGKETDPDGEECSRNGSNVPDTHEHGWSLGDVLGYSKPLHQSLDEVEALHTFNLDGIGNVVSATNSPGDDTGPPDQGNSSPKLRIYPGALYD